METVSESNLIDVLGQLNLLPAEQLSEVTALFDKCGGGSSDFTQTVVERGWLTTFQIDLLLSGRGEKLVLGPYVIVNRLSKTGRSEVYKARHRENDFYVALKVVRAEQLTSTAAQNQFLREMAALADLEHPNIVQFWDADKAGDAYYCAMEYLEGIDLDTMARQQGSLAPAVACQYIRQAALGLQCAYEHNLVHRDIKPANLFVTNPVGESRPLIKILDWGLARLRPTTRGDQDVGDNSGGQSLIGTADYLSPDQAMNPEGVDIRGDIYSLGCTLYFLLTGRTPFGGNGAMQKALQHMTAEPEPVDKLNPNIGRGLVAIVQRMMSKQPAERFQTPAAVALALSPACRSN